MKHDIKFIAFSLLFSSLSLTAAEPEKDPYKNGPQSVAKETAEISGTKNLSLSFETFSLDLAEAATLTRANLDDQSLYSKLLELIAKKAAKQEQLTVIKTLSGTKATAESISEKIYPTEYMPPTSADEKEQPNTAAQPVATAFETRNTGTTIEVELTLSEDGQTVELHMVPETVSLAAQDDFGQGVKMPNFESQRFNSSLTLKTGKPTLVGTINRPPNSKIDPDASNRVYFAFATVTVAKP